jgi:hypothetical protein
MNPRKFPYSQFQVVLLTLDLTSHENITGTNKKLNSHNKCEYIEFYKNQALVATISVDCQKKEYLIKRDIWEVNNELPNY